MKYLGFNNSLIHNNRILYPLDKYAGNTSTLGYPQYPFGILDMLTYPLMDLDLGYFAS